MGIQARERRRRDLVAIWDAEGQEAIFLLWLQEVCDREFNEPPVGAPTSELLEDILDCEFAM